MRDRADQEMPRVNRRQNIDYWRERSKQAEAELAALREACPTCCSPSTEKPEPKEGE